MRKMKKLFKVRNGIIPWCHWAIINFVINFASFIALFITSFFTDDAKFVLTWLNICILQFIPFFIVIFVSWIVTRTIARKAVAIVLERLKGSKLQTEKFNIKVSKHSLHTCTILVTSSAYNSMLLDQIFMPIIHDINRKFGNNYYVYYLRNLFENANKTDI